MQLFGISFAVTAALIVIGCHSEQPSAYTNESVQPASPDSSQRVDSECATPVHSHEIWMDLKSFVPRRADLAKNTDEHDVDVIELAKRSELSADEFDGDAPLNSRILELSVAGFAVMELWQEYGPFANNVILVFRRQASGWRLTASITGAWNDVANSLDSKSDAWFQTVSRIWRGTGVSQYIATWWHCSTSNDTVRSVLQHADNGYLVGWGTIDFEFKSTTTAVVEGHGCVLQIAYEMSLADHDGFAGTVKYTWCESERRFKWSTDSNWTEARLGLVANLDVNGLVRDLGHEMIDNWRSLTPQQRKTWAAIVMFEVPE